jgi:dihydrofolate reductase
MFAIIVAMDENHLIGKGNELPWHYKEDMVYFKETTLNHSVLMGYNTYLSILPRNPHMLKNRTNLVLTSHKDLVK